MTHKKRLITFTPWLIALLALVPLAFGAKNSSNENLPAPTKEYSLLKETSKAFSKIAKEAIPAVVSIRVQGKADLQGHGDQPEFMDPNQFFNQEFFRRFFGNGQPEPQRKQQVLSQGSGFIVSPDGYILTNNHIVHNATDIQVCLSDGKEFPATVVGTDPRTDLAVIKINADNLSSISLGDSNSLDIGEWVVAIGSPFGLNASLTVGVVSAKGRNGLHITDFEDFIQTDAAINPGNSGGPLLNIDGKVIGINTAIVTGSGGYMGIGFAIPSDMAERVMEQLIQNGSVTRGYLGVALQPVDNDLATSFGLDKVQGALVSEVVKNSPAEKGGLQQGDVIMQFNGTQVESISTLRKAISLMSPGTALELIVNRDGKNEMVNITIGTQPTATNSLGMEVEEMSDQGAQNLGYPPEKGVLVKKVEPNSSAAAVGIRPGAIITRVNRQAVSTPDEFYNAIQEAAKKTNKVTLLVKQGQVMRYVTIKAN